jgi:toxin ParE1/3/4
MAEIRWTEEAVKRLQHIFEYISEDNPEAAHQVVKGLYDKVQILKVFPKIGHKYREESESGIRILMYGHYKIAYLNKFDVVEILGVFHSAMQIEKYL